DDDRPREAVKGRRRRARIGERALAEDARVLLDVEKNVAKEIASLGRRADVATVVAICPETPFALEQLVDRARDADLDARDAARDSALVVRLDDQVHVIVLNREVNDLEVLRPRRRQGMALFHQGTPHA